MLACKTLSEVFSVNRIFRRDDNGDNDHRDKNVNSDKMIIKIKINEVFSPSRILLRANEISPLQTLVHTGKAE